MDESSCTHGTVYTYDKDGTRTGFYCAPAGAVTPEKSETDLGEEFGGVIGTLIVGLIIGGIAWFLIRKSNSKEADAGSQVPSGDVKADSSSTYKRIKENCTAIDGLRHSQTYMARFLHLSFLAAWEHPEISKVIRLTAHSAQIQHSLALELMVKMHSNSAHVADTLLQLIIDGIDRKMPELITNTFDEIKKIADQMYSEAEKTVRRYEEIQGEVQNLISDIETENVKLKEYLGQLRMAKEAAEKRIEHEGEKVDIKTAALGRYTTEYDRLCQEKKDLIGEISKARDNERITDRSSDIFTNMLFPYMSVSGLVATRMVGVLCPPIALAAVPVATAVFAGVAFGVNAWNENRKSNEKRLRTGELSDEMEQTEEKIQSALEQERKDENRIIAYKQEQEAAVNEVEKLTLEEDNAADVTGLINATKGLGQVYAQLLRIKEFWGQMVVCIDLINKDTQATYFYKARSDLLRDKVKQSELNWKTFVAVCDKYVSVCKHDDSESIKKLYTFLSDTKDSMTKAQRKEHQAKINDQLRRSIQELGNA